MKILPYIYLMRLHKPLPILLILWPTLTGLVLALNGTWDTKLWVIFTLGVVLMRTAGCIFNDIADRKYDGAVARTHTRPLATGVLSVRPALVCAFILVLLAFICVLFLNALTIAMSVIAMLLALSYPLFKRFFPLPQLVLGLAFNFGILMAFTAVQSNVPLVAWLFYGGTIAWTLAYDTIYALADRPYDIKIGLKSSAVTFGDYVIPAIVILQLLSLLFWLAAGLEAKLGMTYYMALLFIEVHFIYQYFLYRKMTIEKCIQAFSSNHWVGLIILVAVMLSP